MGGVGIGSGGPPGDGRGGTCTAGVGVASPSIGALGIGVDDGIGEAGGSTVGAVLGDSLEDEGSGTVSLGRARVGVGSLDAGGGAITSSRNVPMRVPIAGPPTAMAIATSRADPTSATAPSADRGLASVSRLASSVSRSSSACKDGGASWAAAVSVAATSSSSGSGRCGGRRSHLIGASPGAARPGLAAGAV